MPHFSRKFHHNLVLVRDVEKNSVQGVGSKYSEKIKMFVDMNFERPVRKDGSKSVSDMSASCIVEDNCWYHLCGESAGETRHRSRPICPCPLTCVLASLRRCTEDRRKLPSVVYRCVVGQFENQSFHITPNSLLSKSILWSGVHMHKRLQWRRSTVGEQWVRRNECFMRD